MRSPRTAIPSRYIQLIEHVFVTRHREGDTEVPFERADIETAARQLGIALPKNLGDVLYTFRYRASLPDSIRKWAPAGMEWIIRPAGRGRYRFVAASVGVVTPATLLAETKIPDATPGVIAMYALSDEQSLLAKLRYNRLVDVFTGVTCYSLQSHLRTSVANLGQVETDEIYIGLERRGAHYVIPVQAKGGADSLNVVQIEQDLALCRAKFAALICRPIAAQFMRDDLIALFEFEEGDQGVAIVNERHYRLVAAEAMTDADLITYRDRPLE